MWGLRIRDRAEGFSNRAALPATRYRPSRRRRECSRRRNFLSRLMEKTMRSLKIEELSLVAGGVPDSSPSQSKQNNGLGNFDQTAPGNSLNNNGAENNTGGNTTGNPPGSGSFPVVPN